MANYGFELRDYAYKYISNDVNLEFRDQMRKWKKHTRKLIQYTRLASQNHQGLLTQIRKRQAENAAAFQQFALFGLSLLAGPVLSFVSGQLQYQLGKRLFGDKVTVVVSKPPDLPKPPIVPPPPARPKIEPGKAPNQNQIREYVRTVKIPPLPNYNVPREIKSPPAPTVPPAAKTIVGNKYMDTDLSKVYSKMLGDFGSTVVQDFMLNPAIQAAVPKYSELAKAIAVVPEALNLEMFKENMDTVWETAESVCEHGMLNFAKMFYDDVGWGDRFWSKIVNGSFSDAPRGAGAETAQFEFGKMMIRDFVRRQREHWAMQSDWFFYGNNPDPIFQTEAVYAIEAEIWALWIMKEDYYLKHTFRDDPEGVTIIDAWEAFGNSGIPLDRVMPRLVELGIVTTEVTAELQRRMVAKTTNLPLLAAEVNDIEGQVDTYEELHSLKVWANQRKPKLLGGQYPYAKRAITRELFNNGNETKN